MPNISNLFDERSLQHKGWTVTSRGCWEYRGAPSGPEGYRRIQILGHTYPVHRAAYMVWVGTIPEGEVVRHKCDNPPCINPEHLEPGTQSQNMQDRFDRGRDNTPRGEKHYSVKLQNSDIEHIRTLASMGIINAELARTYNVNPATISRLVNNKRR